MSRSLRRSRPLYVPPSHAARVASCAADGATRGARRQALPGSWPKVTSSRINWSRLCDQQRRLRRRRVLVEAPIPLVRADTVVADREDLIVHVDAGERARCVAPHLRDDQPAAIVAGRDAEPAPRRETLGRRELQAVRVEQRLVFERLRGVERAREDVAEIGARRPR